MSDESPAPTESEGENGSTAHGVGPMKEERLGAAGIRLTYELTLSIGDADTVEDALAVVLRTVCEATGWVLGQAWMPVREGDRLSCVAAWAHEPERVASFREISERTTFLPGVGLPGRAWVSKAPAWIRNVTIDSNFPRASTARECGLAAGMAIPILAKDAVVAVMEFYVHETRDEDELFVQMLSSIAAQLGLLVQRKRAEDDLQESQVALRASEEQFRAVAETAVDAIVSADEVGEITYFNRGATRMFGYTSEEALGCPLTVLMPERFRNQHRAGLARFLATAEPRVIGTTVELAGLRRDGAEFPIELSLATWKISNRISFTSIIRDISERKRAEGVLTEAYEAARLAAERLQELDEMKSDFLSTVSHELRTPMTSISGFAATLLRLWTEMDDHHRRECVERIAKNADQLGNLIDDLLDFSQLEQGKYFFEIASCDLKEAVHSVIQRLSATAHENRIVIQIPDGTAVVADRSALGRVLDNLLSNAVKFSDTGSTIQVEASTSESEVTLRVRDEGVGVPAGERVRIFERFYRASRGETLRPGTGIGLAIVKEFVEAQGGRVWVESNDGHPGSVFSFTLRSADPGHGG